MFFALLQPPFFFWRIAQPTASPRPPPPPPPPKKYNKSLPLLHFLFAFPRTFTHMTVEEGSEDYTLPVETLRWKGVEPSNIFKGELFVERRSLHSPFLKLYRVAKLNTQKIGKRGRCLLYT